MNAPSRRAGDVESSYPSSTRPPLHLPRTRMKPTMEREDAVAQFATGAALADAQVASLLLGNQFIKLEGHQLVAFPVRQRWSYRLRRA